jgi:tyrosyl-tRNA synthetase
VLIIGDYTARIGDPSGRSKTRPALGETEIEAAAATYAEQAFTVLDRERTEIRRNSEWLTMQMPELFELARSTTLAQLLEREDFAARYRSHQPISMLEMLYPLIQGYDSVAVAADVELGGSDQTVNLLLARDIQRHFGVGEQVVLTMPLLVGIDGVAKMSKSLGNHIALTDSAEEAFAKTMSLPDTAMDSWFTLLFNSSPSSDLLPLFRKRLLARSVAELVAGSGASVEAEATWDRVHLARQAPADAPTVTLPAAGAVHLPALLAATFGGSRAQARRHLKEGGVRLDGVVLAKTGLDVAAESLRGHVLQLGKRRFAHLI